MQKLLTYIFVTTIFFWISVSHADIVQWRIEDGGNDHFYEAVLVPGQGEPFIAPITWTEANAAAQARGKGWHLVTISSPEENAFVFSLVENIPEFWFEHGGPPIGNSVGPWLGAFSQTVSRNDFEWVTGEPFNYTNWASLEPNGNGDGLHFFGFFQGTNPAATWNDYIDSFGTKGYIVETVVPVPGAVWLLGSGLIGLVGMLTKCRYSMTSV